MLLHHATVTRREVIQCLEVEPKHTAHRMRFFAGFDVATEAVNSGTDKVLVQLHDLFLPVG